MNIYRISCHSSCGSYFQPYLQSVTVIAENGEHAVRITKEWFKESGNKFIDKNSDNWEVTQVTQSLQAGVVDWIVDSDY